MIAYKYLHPNRTSVLEDNLIRFTQPFALNDPFETTPDLRRFERSFREHAIRLIDRENLSAINYGIARLKIEDRVARRLKEFSRVINEAVEESMFQIKMIAEEFIRENRGTASTFGS